MSDTPVLRAKADVLAVLRRAGLPEEKLHELAEALPDPVDLQRAGNILLRYGITYDGLIDSFGGSP